MPLLGRRRCTPPPGGGAAIIATPSASWPAHGFACSGAAGKTAVLTTSRSTTPPSAGPPHDSSRVDTGCFMSTQPRGVISCGRQRPCHGTGLAGAAAARGTGRPAHASVRQAVRQTCRSGGNSLRPVRFFADLSSGEGTPSGVGMLLASMSREFVSSIRNALVEAR